VTLPLVLGREPEKKEKKKGSVADMVWKMTDQGSPGLKRKMKKEITF